MRNRHIEAVWLTHSFLDDLILIYPVYGIMMLDHGVREFELSLLFVIWSVCALLFEVPSGVVGDLVNRRFYVTTGYFIRATGYLSWLIFPSLSGYAAGFALWTLGSSIHSGTMQSLLHDALAEQGRAREFTRIFGRGRALEKTGLLVAMLLGGFAAETGYSGVLLLSAAAPVLAGLILFLFVAEPARSHGSDGQETFSTTLRAAWKSITGSRHLLMLTAMLLFFTGVSGVLDEYIGPLLRETGALSLTAIGVLSGVILGSQAIGAAVAHRLEALSLRRIGLVTVAAHLVLLVGLGSVLGEGGGRHDGVVWLVACFAGYFAIMGAVGVLLESHLQRRIDVHARATITSVAGAGLEVWGICLYLTIGFSAGLSNWATALLLVTAFATLLSSGLAYVAGPVAARSRS